LPSEDTAAELNGTVEKGIDMLKFELKPADATNGVTANGVTANGVVYRKNKPRASPSEPYLIENIRDFRSRLVVSAGPLPVQDLSEFEELDPKL
jgi:hypothetical protein